jgi:uncharacterized protein (TIGR02271 family)
MSSNPRSNEILVAVYSDQASAESAVQDLVSAGVNRDNISVLSNDTEGRYKSYFDDNGNLVDHDDVSAGEGAGFGAVIGTLAGLGLALIPGVGPILAAGPAAVALTAGVGAAAGAATGGITAGLVDFGVSNEDAQTYQEVLRRGGSLVIVEGASAANNSAYDILNRYNPVDIEERGQAYRTEGWQGYNASAENYTTDQINQHRDQVRTLSGGEQAKVDVVEEELKVGKREVDAGGVRIRKFVTERPITETVTLRQENINVDRHPVDRPATDADFTDDVIEVTARSEEAVVSKEARVIEEVLVSKDVSQREETIQDSVRRTDVEIEQGIDSMTTGQTEVIPYETYETDFRTDYDTNFVNSGYSYEQISPAYRYGYSLGTSPRYSGSTWEQVEADARIDWEARNPNTWDRVSSAIRRAWDRTTNR